MGSTVSKSEVCGVGIPRPIIHPAKWTKRLGRIQAKRREARAAAVLQNEVSQGKKATSGVDR